MSDPVLDESDEQLRLRLRCAGLVSKAIDKIAAAMDRVDWSRASPLEFVRAMERLVVIHRLVLGAPMTVEQVDYHLGPDDAEPPDDAAGDVPSAPDA